MRGLIIEDSLLTARVVEEILKLDGHSVLIAKNGKEGLQCMENMEDIDFVISDIEMPEMDGLSFLKKIRLRVEWEDLPFILMTGRADASNVKKAAALGCKHFLVKPPDQAQFRQKVKEAVGPEMSILLHKSIVLKRFNFSTAVYEKLLEDFAQEIENTIQLVENALPKGKSDAASKAILNLREGANILGANRLEKQFTKLPKVDKNEKSRQVINRQPAFLREMKALRRVLMPEHRLWHGYKEDTVHRQRP